MIQQIVACRRRSFTQLRTCPRAIWFYCGNSSALEEYLKCQEIIRYLIDGKTSNVKDEPTVDKVVQTLSKIRV